MQVRQALEITLEDGVTFYLTLIMKLQEAYGDVNCKLSARQQAQVGAEALRGLEPAAEQRDISKSVANCLICVGDLTRYDSYFKADV